MAWTGQQRPAGHRAWAMRVLNRDGWKCQRCGYQGTRGKGDVQADHTTPLARGGTYTLENGQTLCIPCHGTKSQGEAAEGLRLQGRRNPDQEPHPGLLARRGPSGGGG